MDTKAISARHALRSGMVDSHVSALMKLICEERIDAKKLITTTTRDAEALACQRMQDLVLGTVTHSFREFMKDVPDNKVMESFALKLAADIWQHDSKFDDLAFLRDCGLDQQRQEMIALAQERAASLGARVRSTEDLRSR